RITRTTTFLSSALDVLPGRVARKSQIPSSNNQRNSKRQRASLEPGFWCLQLFESLLNHNRCTLIHQFEQFDHVRVTHAHAAMTRRRADLVLMPGAVNIDEAVARIRVVLVQSVEPQNARHHKVFGRRRRVAGFERDAAYKNGAARHLASNFLRHPKTPSWSFQAPLVHADTKPRRGDWVSADRLPIISHGELLISN